MSPHAPRGRRGEITNRAPGLRRPCDPLPRGHDCFDWRPGEIIVGAPKTRNAATGSTLCRGGPDGPKDVVQPDGSGP
jgi:hypothetical protein